MRRLPRSSGFVITIQVKSVLPSERHARTNAVTLRSSLGPTGVRPLKTNCIWPLMRISACGSEGTRRTLLSAVGSGLAIIPKVPSLPFFPGAVSFAVISQSLYAQEFDGIDNALVPRVNYLASINKDSHIVITSRTPLAVVANVQRLLTYRPPLLEVIPAWGPHFVPPNPRRSTSAHDSGMPTLLPSRAPVTP